LVILTDGDSNNSSDNPCSGTTPNVSIPNDVTVFAVNVGSGAKPAATDCVADQSFDVSNFSGLGAIVDTLVSDVCA
jgi:hypothetical protein